MAVGEAAIVVSHSMLLPGATNHASVSFWRTIDSGLKYMRPNSNKSAQHVKIYDKVNQNAEVKTNMLV